MKKLYSLLLTALFALPAAHVHATDYTQGLSIWFDTPNTLQGKAIWYGSRPDLWKGESKPESAGDTARNPDANWESQLPHQHRLSLQSIRAYTPHRTDCPVVSIKYPIGKHIAVISNPVTINK